MPKCPYCSEEKDLEFHQEDSENDWDSQETWEAFTCCKCQKKFFIVGKISSTWYEDSEGWKISQKKETRKDTDV